MDTSEIARGLHIGQKEMRVYLATVELGSSTAAKIAKKAGIQRTNFYDIADRLIEKGLLQQITKGKRRLFSAVEPDMLIEEEERRLTKLKKTMPELMALYNTAGQKPRIFYYEGKTGIDQINEDTLRYKGEMVAFTTPRFVSASHRQLGRQYIQKRIAIGNRVRVIGEDSPEVRELKVCDSEELRETRIVSRDTFHSEVEIGIYGNKVFVVDYKEEFGFIIEGSEIAKAMKMIFELVWNRWVR